MSLGDNAHLKIFFQKRFLKANRTIDVGKWVLSIDVEN